MENNPVGWFEIYVQEMDRARAFYEEVLHVKLEPLNSLNGPNTEVWTFPLHKDRAGAAGALVKMKGFPSGGNSTLVYFTCNNCGIEASRVVAAGGQILREKRSIGDSGFIALAIDPEGNMFGLHSNQ